MSREKRKIALHSTVLSGNTVLVKDMIKSVRDVNYVDESYNTPLHIAAIKGYIEIARMLINNNANIDGRNHHGSTPLHLAIQFNNTASALELIANGADVNIKDRYGETALHLAVSKNNIILVKRLIENKAQINAVNFVSMTPLAIAVKSSNTPIIAILRNAGAVTPKNFFSTSIYAFKASNIVRKTMFASFITCVFSVSFLSAFSSSGQLQITLFLAGIAAVGAALVCFGRPYQRVRDLERRVLNELMTQDELDNLMFSKQIESDNKGIFSDTMITCEASNDNAKVIRSVNKKGRKSRKVW
jgi:ankyrin repeat protein